MIEQDMYTDIGIEKEETRENRDFNDRALRDFLKDGFVWFGFFVVLLLCLVPVSALESDLGDCVDLFRTCANCDYVNITNIVYPNNSILNINTSFVKNDTYYSYTFCNTTSIGEYVANIFYNYNGEPRSSQIFFTVVSESTENAFYNLDLKDPLTIVFLAFLFFAAFFILFFFSSTVAGALLMLLGFLLLVNGFSLILSILGILGGFVLLFLK